MKKLFGVVMLSSLFLSAPSFSGVACEGTIHQVYKWSDKDTLSILLTGATHWIKMPTKSDESLALLAFASGKPVTLYWSAPDVTSCTDGWSHNRVLEGYILVKK
ncbi:hypothetical protein [Teredinibacter sp. KSP-S5-2]|uniref:hypothetical protein n=1 Tax=Teredinibacter sp. KSP-S5-2 TaxID=3034506 RepID=UPI0029344C16|nr:hypothetical protein [Teredinibacter sp. KSP-S5-2]WNO08248.1 hypothetical protein P5V12_14855 [Teredinibacter sp. KSP-S5-2]